MTLYERGYAIGKANMNYPKMTQKVRDNAIDYLDHYSKEFKIGYTQAVNDEWDKRKNESLL